MVDEILLDSEDRMEKTISALQNDLKPIRTGRASPALVEHIPIEYYGMPTAMNQLATISVPEPRLITIKPFSASDIGDISKAIMKSDLGITPTNDGKIIRLVIPPLTEERRRLLVKQVHGRVEEARVSARNIRRDANELLKDAEKDKVISEDDMYAAREDVQKLLDATIKQIDAIGAAKEVEIMEI
ncbi:MAG TPA: ribosome recycling factor [Anaerolineae bacterium]|nr:ribosome recycling factor [Anaerolineae bacterium]HNU04987.1 ribosome recycling factor [Anaerolineae bacterium]